MRKRRSDWRSKDRKNSRAVGTISMHGDFSPLLDEEEVWPKEVDPPGRFGEVDVG